VRAAAIVLALAAPFAAASAAASPAPPALEEGKKPDLPALVKFLQSFFRKSALSAKDPEAIGQRLAGVSAEDLAWVLERLREVPAKERGAAAAAVEKLVDDARLSTLWGAGILRLPDAATRLDDPSAPARCSLLADASRLEDPEPGTRLALEGLADTRLVVRLRAVETAADLASWAGDPARLVPALVKALEDASPAVRDVALERLADIADMAAVDWALAHAGEPAAEHAEVRGRKETRCPGDRATAILNRASRTQTPAEPEAVRALSEAERKELLDGFRAWRASVRGNPLRDGGEGPFDPLPKLTTAIVDPRKAPTATLRWWSEVDRAQFRLDLDEFDVGAITKEDFRADFRLMVIASGQRQGDWEAFARHLRCGMRHRLPRRGFGLIETTIQPLLDGRWKVFVRAYEARGG
jgi:hypothetical protein